MVAELWKARVSETSLSVFRSGGWEETRSDLVGLTTLAEHAALIDQLGNFRPGPSGWKLCFIDAFSAWVQEMFW